MRAPVEVATTPRSGRAETASTEVAASRGAAAAAVDDGFVGPLGEALAELAAGSERRHFVEEPASREPGKGPVWASRGGGLQAPGKKTAPAGQCAASLAGVALGGETTPSATPLCPPKTAPPTDPREAARTWAAARTPETDSSTSRRPGDESTGARCSDTSESAAPAERAGAMMTPPAAHANLVAGPSVLSVAASLGSWISTSAAAPGAPQTAGGAGAATGAATASHAAISIAGLPDLVSIHVVAVGGASQTARVELLHSELGPILLDLRLERGGLEVRAVTASAATATSLMASESALRESIALAGVELRSLRVDRRDCGSEDGAERGRKRRRRRPLDTEA